MKENLKVVISGGGTGGHIFPAIAIADALKRRFPEADILFIGAKGRMEMERVPKAGYPIKGLWISGFTKDIRSLALPVKLMDSINRAIAILKRFKPDVVIGVGGFASGPTLMAANYLRIPTVIQEQNSYPGKTNRNVGKKAKAICVAYDHLDQWFPAEKIHFTGNPLRANIVLNGTREEAAEYLPKRYTSRAIHCGPTSSSTAPAKKLPNTSISTRTNLLRCWWAAAKVPWASTRASAHNWPPSRTATCNSFGRREKPISLRLRRK